MAAGKITLQANDTRIYAITAEDGASSNVAITLPKEGGMLTVDSEVVHKTGDETKTGTMTFMDNVGIGVNPRAWGSATKAVDIKNGSFYSTSDSDIQVAQNTYFNSSGNWIYKTSGYASAYYQLDGTHSWRTAPSGTVGNPITWTTGLTVPLGGGIQLPNTAIADANTLDWYEEGTFTPTIVGTTTAGVGTYTYQIGKYTRIGNAVNIMINIPWTAHTGTGNMRLGGLPFSAITTQGFVIGGYNLTITGQLYLELSATHNLYSLNNGTASLLIMDTSGAIVCNFTYFV